MWRSVNVIAWAGLGTSNTTRNAASTAREEPKTTLEVKQNPEFTILARSSHGRAGKSPRPDKLH